jgi:molybdopterin/thiamine biosynthesis adenylyltransferase
MKSNHRDTASAAAGGTQRASATKHVAIVGLGNTGSHLVPLVGRDNGVAEVTLIDFDSYEAKNVLGQSIDAADLGPKVAIQARRLRRINPAIEIHPICARVEDVPVGLLRADVILAGLDSRAARRHVNRLAWRLGVPWIDAAVDAAGLLVRVHVYVPGGDSPCLECEWDKTDYALLEQEYPCLPQGQRTPATNAPASLGALAAGLMAIECRKVLDGDREHLLAGRQVMADFRHHLHDVTSFRRRSDCQFDHETWRAERLLEPPSRLTLGQVVQQAGAGGVALGLEGQSFVRALFCPACGCECECPPCLSRRIAPARRRCPKCGQAMSVRGFDMFDWLETGALAAGDRRRWLSSLGFRAGDMLTVRDQAGEHHWEFGERSRQTPCAARPR